MAKAFKKGDLVTYLNDWDRKGTVTFRHAIVHSCGAKQMVLTDAKTGEEMGRHFAPELGTIGKPGTFPRMTTEEAQAAGLELANTILANERAHFTRCLNNPNTSEQYKAAVRKDLDSLHGPAVLEFPSR